MREGREGFTAMQMSANRTLGFRTTGNGPWNERQRPNFRVVVRATTLEKEIGGSRDTAA
jgi:hypothetical protein